MKKFKIFFVLYLISIHYNFSQEGYFPINVICPKGIQQIFNPNWEQMGPIKDIPISVPNVGLVSSLAINPKNPQIVFLASNTGGVYKTENFLDSIPTWKSCTNDLKWYGLGINDIVIDPNNTNVIYATTGYSAAYGDNFGFGVIKSSDSGNTWKAIGPGKLKNDNLSLKLKIDYTNSNIVWLSQNETLYKNNSLLNKWDTIFTLPSSKGMNPYHPNSECRKIVDIEQSLENPNCWIITTDFLGSKKEVEQSLIFISLDNGLSWRKILLPSKYKSDKIVVSTSKNDFNKFFFTGNYYDENKKTNLNFILTTDDYGKTLNLINEVNISGTSYFRQELEFSELTKNIYIGGYYVSYSNDDGKSFFQNTRNVHVDCRSLKVMKINDSLEFLISGNDGGISLSMDYGKTWINKNGVGLNIKQFHAVGVANSTPNLFAGGTQDNDIAIFDGEWSSPQLSNDGSEVVIDKIDNRFLYAQPFCCDPSQLKVRKYQKVNNKWKVVESISPPESTGNSLRPFKQFDDGSLIIAYHDVWKSSRNKLKWNKISSFTEDFLVKKKSSIKDIAIDEEDTSKILVIFEGPSWNENLNEGYFYTSKLNKNGKMIWVDLTQNLPAVVPRWLALSCVELDKNDNSTFYIGTNEIMTNDTLNYPYNGQLRVIRSIDNGNSWEDYSRNLPPFKVNKILSQKGIKGSLYIATDVGVFYTNDEIYKNNGWLCLNENMPVAITTDLDINYCEGKIYCATYGSGIWRSDLYSSENKVYYKITKNQEFTSNKTFEKSIIISKNKILTLKNASFSLPANGEIILEKGSKLILDNATLSNICQNNWKIIEETKQSNVIILNNSKIITNELTK